MAEESLTGLKIKDTYEGLLHVSDGGISGNSGEAAVTKVYDGVGKSTCLEISKDYLKVIGDGKFESPLGDPILTIKSVDGAVGIGTDNIVASAALDVRGGYITLDDNNSGVFGWVTQGTPGNGIGLAGGGQAGGVVADLYVAQNGEVGIGTETPAKKLHLVGQMRYEHGTPEVGQVMTCTSTTGDVAWQDSIVPGVIESLITQPITTFGSNFYLAGTVITGTVTGVWAGRNNQGKKKTELTFNVNAVSASSSESVTSQQTINVAEDASFSEVITFTVSYTIPSDGNYRLSVIAEGAFDETSNATVATLA
jgi:hypothetical protein